MLRSLTPRFKSIGCTQNHEKKLYLNRRSSIFNLIIFLRRAFEYFLKNVLFGRSPVYRVDFPTARFEILFWWWYRGGGIREGGTSWYNAVKGVVYREPVALSPLSPPSRNKIEKINRNKIRNFLKFKNLPRFKDFGSIDI